MTCGTEKTTFVPRPIPIPEELKDLDPLDPAKSSLEMTKIEDVPLAVASQLLGPSVSITLLQPGTIPGTVRIARRVPNPNYVPDWTAQIQKYFKTIPGIIHSVVRHNGEVNLVVFTNENEKQGFELAHGASLVKQLTPYEKSRLWAQRRHLK